MKQLEMEGIGRRLDENRGQQGRFRVKHVDCVHSFTAQHQTLYQVGDMRREVSVITVQPQEMRERAEQLNKEQITLFSIFSTL
jgi:hypothetical protein